MDYPLKHYPMLEHLAKALDSALFLLDGWCYEYGAINGLDGVGHAEQRERLTHSIIRQQEVVKDVYALIRKYDTHFSHPRLTAYGSVVLRKLGGNDPRQDSVSKS
jgi:hypothetical protein